VLSFGVVETSGRKLVRKEISGEEKEKKFAEDESSGNISASQRGDRPMNRGPQSSMKIAGKRPYGVCP
jgi:hypothetical protein